MPLNACSESEILRKFNIANQQTNKQTKKKLHAHTKNNFDRNTTVSHFDVNTLWIMFIFFFLFPISKEISSRKQKILFRVILNGEWFMLFNISSLIFFFSFTLLCTQFHFALKCKHNISIIYLFLLSISFLHLLLSCSLSLSNHFKNNKFKWFWLTFQKFFFSFLSHYMRCVCV